jgi:aminoglycoside phosphotransferase (APT) family kinase protein
MIPEAKKAAVKQALQAAFGVNEFEDIRAMTAGLSTALVFRIVVRGRPYLLRIITLTNEMNAPAHWYDCMKAAAEAGLAPHVWYTSVEDRISITDFVEAKPFPVHEARVKMPELLKRLHSLPPFPARVNYFDTINGFIQKLQAAKRLPDNITAELMDRYTDILLVYPRNNQDQVSSHNDLKPENVLFDGSQVWLVDWEAAFLNDRYFDLAVAANFVVTNDVEERNYLKRYFGEEVDEYHLARFFLMRQLLHISYFTLFMFLGSAPGEQIDVNWTKSGFREFHNGIWTGKIDLVSNDTRQLYAWVHREQLLHNLRLKRFDESMRIVAGRNQDQMKA